VAKQLVAANQEGFLICENGLQKGCRKNGSRLERRR